VRNLEVICATSSAGFRARSEGKIFSWFEPSTEIIRKGKAAEPNEFGKIMKLQEGEKQIVIDYEVYDQRPNDADLLVPTTEINQVTLGRTPPLMAADAAFYSNKNEKAAIAKGSSASVSPIAPPKALSANASRRSTGSAMSEMANRMRGTHRRRQAPSWPQSLPVQRRRQDDALSWTWRDRR
jgi:hypothetical protein